MKIKIIHNPSKKWARELVPKVKKKLLGLGYEIVRNDANTGADASICIGGDGTILYANYKGRLEGNVLGIGSKSSYVCQLRDDNWEEKIDLVLRSGTIPVMCLETSFRNRTFIAINDFVIHSVNYRVLGIEINAPSNQPSSVFDGDGLIISSSAGSAAYAYSAGGKIFGINERKIQVVPICPYKRMFEPMILEEKDNISIIVHHKAALIVDGILLGYIQPKTQLKFGKGKDIMFYRRIN